MKSRIGLSQKNISLQAYKRAMGKRRVMNKISKERLAKQKRSSSKSRKRKNSQMSNISIDKPKIPLEKNKASKMKRKSKRRLKSKSKSKSKSRSASSKSKRKRNKKKKNQEKGAIDINVFMRDLCFLLEDFKRISKKINKRNKIFEKNYEKAMPQIDYFEANNTMVLLQSELIQKMTENYSQIELKINKIFLLIEKYLFGEKLKLAASNNQNISISNLSNSPKKEKNSSSSFNINIDHKPSNFTVNHNIFTPNFAEIDMIRKNVKDSHEYEFGKFNNSKKEGKKITENFEETSSELEHYEITPKGMCDSFDFEQASKDITLRDIKLQKEDDLHKKIDGISEISRKGDNYSSYNNTFGMTGFLESKSNFSLPKNLKDNIRKINQNSDVMKISKEERSRIKEVFDRRKFVKPFSTLQNKNNFDEERMIKESEMRVKQTILDIFGGRSKESSNTFEK